MKFHAIESLQNLRVPSLGVFDSKEEARHLFRFMKIADSQEAIWSRSIVFPKGPFENYRLVPVSFIHETDSDVINELIIWRNLNIRLYSSQKLATFESTQKWLKTLLEENEDRILFFVVNSHGKRLGHLGLWLRENEKFEIDNVIKSPSCEVKGLFSEAVKTLGRWASEFIGIEHVQLRVLETNLRAITFYERIGFSLIHRQPLNKIVRNEEITLVESNDEVSDTAWLTMSVSLENFQDTDEYVLTAGPSIGAFEVGLVSEAVRMGWNHHHSDFLNEFTKAFASYVGAEFAIPTDSCTSALHLALWSLGIGPGDEVIVPEVTWVATANAVKYVGATPIFADIDPKTWCLDPKSVETLITKRTRAIMPVHLYGYVSDLNPLKNLCDKFDLKLVQDAAPGIGSTYFGQGVAKIGEFSCFSFQGAKLLVSGEGGVLTTNDADLYAKAFKIGDSGRRPGTFWIELLGKKMKMSNVTASLALAQLQSAERQIAKKRKIRDWYVEELSEIEGVTFQQELPNSRSICWMTSIQLEREKFDREKFRSELLKLGVESRPVFSPISRYPIWGKELEPKPNAVKIGDNSINLPSGVALSRSTVAKVSDAVRRVLL